VSVRLKSPATRPDKLREINVRNPLVDGNFKQVSMYE
jgi:hypothetical protein